MISAGIPFSVHYYNFRLKYIFSITMLTFFILAKNFTVDIYFLLKSRLKPHSALLLILNPRRQGNKKSASSERDTQVFIA